MQVQVESLEPTLFRYTRRYPDVPPEVILKEDLLRLGLQINRDALALLRGCRTQAYFLFSYNMSSVDALGEDISALAPEDISFFGGPLALRRTSVRVVLSAKSPYQLCEADGKLAICENGELLAEVALPSKPPYYGNLFDDGTRYEQVVPLLYNHYAFVTTFRVCHYWGDKEECKFCDINEHVRQLRRQSGDHVLAEPVKEQDKVVAAIRAMYEEKSPEFRLVTVLMTSGSILRKVRGGAGNPTDFNLPYVEGIRAAIGNQTPIVLITESQPIEQVRRLHRAGVTSHNANLEVWDRELFEVIAPGKQKYVGYDCWLHNLYDAVTVMGEGNVSPNMVSGIEMVQPWGFKSVQDAVASAREGFETLMSHGVVPHLDTWCIEPGSRLENHPPPPLDFLVQADIAWYETWRKYSLPPFSGYGPMGAPGCAIYGNSASVDMGG